MSNHWSKKTDPTKPVVVSEPASQPVSESTSEPSAQPASNPGPTSPAGKSISSKNAVRHGCCAGTVLILANESEQDFKALETNWCKAYNPQSEPERHLVQDLVVADWLLQRATRAHAEIESQLYAATPNPMGWSETQERKLSTHLRYRTAQTNIVAKCRKAIDDYRKARLNEQILLSRARKQSESNKPKPTKTEPTWKEHLQNMRNQAISLGFVPPPEPPNPTKR